MRENLVSVIMLTYNRENYLPFSIGSILAQTHQEWELIIVDDGSTDNSRTLIENFKDPRISYHYFEHSRYGSRLRNFACSQANGKYITILDSDDCWLPEKLEIQLGLFRTNHDIGFTFSDVIEFDDSDTIIRNGIYKSRGANFTIGNFFDDYVHNRFAIYPSSMMFLAATVGRIGGWNEDHRWTDNEFFHHLAFHFSGVLWFQPLTRIRKHANNHSTLYLQDTITEMIPLIASLYGKQMISQRTSRKMTAYYHYMSGILYRNAREYPAASTAFRRCLHSDPFHSKAMVRLLMTIFHF